MPRVGFAFAALAVTSVLLNGCTATGEPSPPVSPTPTSSLPALASPIPAPSLLALASPDSGREIARVTDHSGPWSQTVGQSDDTGTLDITVACVGGGSLAITYGVAADNKGSMRMPCEGREVTQNRDESIGNGQIDLTIEPDGEQRWSAVITRGAS